MAKVKAKTQWIVVQGNPSDGFIFHGPFKTSDDALDYADKNLDSWWIVQLTKPVEE